MRLLSNPLILPCLILVSLLATPDLSRAQAQTAAPATRPATRAGRGRGLVIPPRNPALPTLWIIGDSTVKNGTDRGENGQWGWGNPIAFFFDRTKLNVVNFAIGGTSSRTYQTGGRWQAIMGAMKPGDFVIMQFGHNDVGALDGPLRARVTLPGNGEETQEVVNATTQQHEIIHTYGWYMRKYVADAQAHGAAECIICSLIPRNNWTGDKVDPNQGYVAWAADAAKQSGAEFIDLHQLIAAKYEALGKDKVTAEYYPDKETTHTDWAGAILNAQIVVAGIQGLDHSKLDEFILANPPTDIKLPSGKAR